MFFGFEFGRERDSANNVNTTHPAHIAHRTHRFARGPFFACATRDFSAIDAIPVSPSH
jgi:hypothetical protein